MPLKLLDLRGRGYKSRLLNPVDEFWDRRLGIQTFGYHPGSGSEGNANWQVHYSPTPYADLIKLFRRVNLGKHDVFTDLGCGLGRAVFLAAWMGARRSIGVEIVPALWSGANSNHQKSRVPHERVEFILGGAENFQFEEVTVLFMFHPFGEDTLGAVLERLAPLVRAEQKLPLRIIYLNPVYNRLLEKTSWLEPTGRERTRRWLGNATEYDVTFWRSRE